MSSPKISESKHDTQHAISLAVEFNNAGVQFLKRRALDEAWAMFKGALETAKLEYRQDYAFLDSHCVMGNSHVQSATALLYTQGRRQRDSKNDSDHESNPFSKEDSTHCFKPHPFEVQGVDFSQPDSSMLSTAIVSAVVLYNLALVDHMRWLEGLESDKSVIDVILKLYALSYGLTQQEDLEEYLVHLNLALHNNIGTLFYDLGKYDVARMYLDGLAYRMSLLSARGCLSRIREGASKAIIHGSDPFEGFISNVMLLYPPTAAPSA